MTNVGSASDGAAMPVFPLPGLVALPGNDVAFHFFEPRYRALARDLLERGSEAELALAETVPGADPRTDDAPMFAVASVARPIAADVHRDGTVDVLFRVERRAKLSEVSKGARPYRLVVAETMSDIERPSAALEATAASLRACARELREVERQYGGEGGVRLDGPPGLVADRLAHRYFRGDPRLRRRVLETVDVLERGELVLEHLARLLAMLRHPN